jgi:thymidylate synthase
MIDEVTRDVFARGIEAFDKTWQGIEVSREDYSMKEIINYSYLLKGFKDKDELIKFTQEKFSKPDVTKEWAEQWHRDRISGKALPQPSWKLRRKYWEPMLEKGETFSYSYEERFVLLDRIIDKMRLNKYMRGACLTVFETTRDFTNMGKRRIPCSMYYHFIVRKEENVDKLTLIYNMRSCDLANHFAVDVYTALRLLEHVAYKLDVVPAYFYHNISSLHIYKRDCADDRKW